MSSPAGSDRDVICLDGPLHRRVYSATDWARQGRPDYTETDRVKRLGDIYLYGLSKGAGERLVQTWEWCGTDPPPRRTPPAFIGACLRCGALATRRVSAPYDAAWLGCDAHYGAMADAFKQGRGDGYYVSVDPI